MNVSAIEYPATRRTDRGCVDPDYPSTPEYNRRLIFNCDWHLRAASYLNSLTRPSIGLVACARYSAGGAPRGLFTTAKMKPNEHGYAADK